MKRLALILLTCLSVPLAGCGGHAVPSHDLDGTWQSRVITVTMNFEQQTYQAVFLGDTHLRKLTFLSEEGNVVRFKIDDINVTCQILEDGSIVLTRENGIPVRLVRTSR
jgi:hypothetical protein